MHQTNHIHSRQNQRGISNAMVELAVHHGTVVNDKYVLGRKEASKRLDEIREEQRTLMKVMDKGGIVVVEEDNAQITTYNCSRRPRA